MKTGDMRRSTYLSVGCRQTVKAFLNNMIAIQILNKLDDMITKGINDGTCLLGSGDKLNHLLQSSSSVLVESYLDQL